jgi:hypothetical protein
MATYQDSGNVTRKEDPMFTPTYPPGTPAPHSGIYMCINCRDEDACNRGNPLPPQNHRQHRDTTRPIRWRLLVCTQRGPD